MQYRTIPQHVLEALPAHTAVVSADGEIVSVNEPWKRFADENGLGSSDYCVGESYLDACGSAPEDDPVAASVSRAIRQICAGELIRAEFEYPCHSPIERRWFVVHISRMEVDGKGFALVMHENVTHLKGGEEDLGRIAEGLNANEGPDFFFELAEGLRAVLPVDGVVVTELLAGGENRVRVLGGSGLSPEAGAEFILADSPEARLSSVRRLLSIPSGASAAFAEDSRFGYGVIEGFVGAGAGLTDRGLPMGMVGLLSRRPIVGIDHAGRVARIFAARAGEELHRRDAMIERERAETLTRRIDRLSVLAGGVAHEFNNILTAFGAHLNEATRRSGEGRSPAPSHERLVDLARQARALTDSLSNLTKGCESVRKPLRLADVAREAIATIEPLLPSVTTITLNADERVRVLGDSDQLQRALMNLMFNARNAMAPGGGRIVIGVSRSGDDASLSVDDTGRGLSGEVRDHMFDPYFTTGEDSGGTGLGLSVVDDIAREHGGRVTVRSEPGVGTTMTVVIPAIGSPREPERPEVDLAGGKDTRPAGEQARSAVVIEDNPDVLGVVAGMLASMGYAVIERDGVAPRGVAPEWLPQNTALVVADLDLPGGDGESLLKGMREAGYGGPAVLMSGSRAAGISTDSVLGAALLAKPFGETELRSAIGLALDLCRGD